MHGNRSRNRGEGDRMVTRDFVNGVCVGMSVVNLIWIIMVQILIIG